MGEPQHVVSERLLTIPNVLSILRLLGVPVFLWAILSGRDGLALLLLLFSGVTDYLDGKIARQFNMESRLGGFLDPIADRLYILATLFGLMWRDIIPVWLVVVLLARELVMAMMLLYLRSRGQVGLPVHFVGKAATFNLLYAFPLLLLAHRDDWIGDLAQTHRVGLRVVGRRPLLAGRRAVCRPRTDRAHPGFPDGDAVTAPRRPDESMTLLTTMMERPLDPGYQEAADRRAAAGLPRATSTRTVLVVVLAILTGFLFAVAAQSLRPKPTAAAALKKELVTRIEALQKHGTDQEAKVADARQAGP